MGGALKYATRESCHERCSQARLEICKINDLKLIRQYVSEQMVVGVKCIVLSNKH